MGWRELEALLPNIFVISAAIFLLVSRFLDYLKHRRTVSGIIELLENNPDIDPDMLKSLNPATASRFSDLRRGILLIAIAAACLIFAQNMIDPEYRFALRGLSAFPGLIGLVYLIFHFLPENSSSDKQD